MLFRSEEYLNFVDFRGYNKYYGLRNKNNLQVIPKQSRILADDDYNISAIDFVIIAYKEMAEKFFYYVSNKTIPKTQFSQYISAPFASYQEIDFNKTLEDNRDDFHKNVIIEQKLGLSTLNISDYIKIYPNYVSYFKTKTQTHLKYLKNYLSRNVNGLTITLLDTPKNNDQKKVDFMNDVNFLVYRKLAEQYGFYVDSNIPWQLTANLSHPNIRAIIDEIEVASQAVVDKNNKTILPIPITAS